MLQNKIVDYKDIQFKKRYNGEYIYSLGHIDASLPDRFIKKYIL